MTTLLIALHVIVCIALIIIVLLQAGKGAEIGAQFGAGSSQTIFGAGGGKDFMSRLTASAAIIFMLTSLTLAYFYGQPGSGSIMPSSVSAPAPAPAAPAAPAMDTASAPQEPVSEAPAAAPVEEEKK
ncbi:MAG: preprotein translocase subunit SecG [Desulfuromonas sp.]|nr:MAG: preprotein translocase subunit SecG [Desulfuromonas sp.]